MRKVFLHISLGVLSINCFVGCGIVQRKQDDCCDHVSKRSVKPLYKTMAKNKGTVVGTGDPAAFGTARPRENDYLVQETRPQAGAQSKPLTGHEVMPPLPPMPLARGEDVPGLDKIIVSSFPDESHAKQGTHGTNVNPGGVQVVVMPDATKSNAQPSTLNMPATSGMGDGSNGKEKTVAIKSIHIQYGHAEGFQSVTGQVQQFRKAWRLRYAAVDQEDAYGGSVILEGSDELSRLRDGQHVRVRGVLVPPEDRTASARYRVLSIEVLD